MIHIKELSRLQAQAYILLVPTTPTTDILVSIWPAEHPIWFVWSEGGVGDSDASWKGQHQ